MTILADAHTHLDQFPNKDIPGILQRAWDAEVGFIIIAGVTEASSQRGVALAEQYEGVYAGIGIHPEEARVPLDGNTYQKLKTLAHSSSKVVCLSEVGLDFAPGMPPIDIQEQVLRQEVRLARELGLPVIFHSREFPDRLSDHQRILEVLKEERIEEVGAAWHYFQWSKDMAEACFDLGMHVSIAKPLLRLPDLQAVVKDLPLERLVLETDTYPQTFKRNRARWTEPKDVLDIATAIAQLKGISLEQVAEVTTGNLLRLLKGRVVLPAPAGQST
ncbi:MAG: TatD family hydrolase [Chloroflexi bacterium]|nr:TatD family hydrolase [Chloroflexota bacterium]